MWILLCCRQKVVSACCTTAQFSQSFVNFDSHFSPFTIKTNSLNSAQCYVEPKKIVSAKKTKQICTLSHPAFMMKSEIRSVQLWRRNKLIVCRNICCSMELGQKIGSICCFLFSGVARDKILAWNILCGEMVGSRQPCWERQAMLKTRKYKHASTQHMLRQIWTKQHLYELRPSQGWSVDMKTSFQFGI